MAPFSRLFPVNLRFLTACAGLGCFLLPLSAGGGEFAEGPAAAITPASDPPVNSVEAATSRCIEFLVSCQEAGDGATEKAEWPYEGVYRVRGRIPIGYRIGGTSIASIALMAAPGFDADQARQQAVRRAVAFVLGALHEDLMNPDYEGGYDVRGWGYTYALQFLLNLKANGTLAGFPPDQRERVESDIRWCIAAIQQTEINQVGGWNYARAQGKEAVSPPSPFMTSPTLTALFDARRQGYEVDDAVVERGLKALERGREDSGSYVYSGNAHPQRPEKIPGAVGRMLASEIALYLAGRSDISRIRGALDSFLLHWEWLDKRRAKNGTHEGPYQIAPYYFYYAHAYAAQAIEFLPKADRAEYRRRLLDKLWSVRLENGTWNDRVFERTANYGTSQALLVLIAPNLPEPARWKGPPSPPADAGAVPAKPEVDDGKAKPAD